LYKEHLTEIALAAAEFNVPLMLTTVASNLRDHVDNQTPGDFPPTAQARLHSLAEMVDKVDRGSFLRAIDDAQPELQSEGAQFQLGQLLLRGGLRNAAFKAFEDAEMLALRPMSSDRQLRQTVRNVAQQHEVPLCDLAATLAASSADGSPGNDLFVDHCHPNAAGHHQLGVTLARCIVRDDLLKLGITDTVLETAIKHVETTTVDPFRLDHFTGHRPIPGMKTPSPPPADTALGSAQRGHLAFVASDFDGALRAYKRAESMGAPVPAILLNQGLTHLYLGDLAAARTAIDKAAESATENANINQLRRTLGD
jgi:tetratricopeptide (TPR) repeat protein